MYSVAIDLRRNSGHQLSGAPVSPSAPTLIMREKPSHKSSLVAQLRAQHIRVQISSTLKHLNDRSQIFDSIVLHAKHQIVQLYIYVFDLIIFKCGSESFNRFCIEPFQKVLLYYFPLLTLKIITPLKHNTYKPINLPQSSVLFHHVAFATGFCQLQINYE